jgi:hypothetical protein
LEGEPLEQRRKGILPSQYQERLVKEQIYPNRATVTADIVDYLDRSYNPLRHHSHLGGVGPREFEVAHRSHGRDFH